MAVNLTLIIILNLCPIFFYIIIWRNKAYLEKKEVKEKIGSLYLGLNGTKSGVSTYSTVFLVRRSIFVTITFALFHLPELQVLLMLCMTLIYIAYIGHMYFYDVPTSKTLEIVNESLFVILQYNLVILTGLIYDNELRLVAGYQIIGLASFLLAMNLVIIMFVGIKGLIRKCYLRR